jgi:hypothetical protein
MIVGLEKELKTLVGLCNPLFYDEEPTLNDLNLLAVVFSRLNPARRSKNFLAEVKPTQATGVSFETALQVVNALRARLASVPKQIKAFDKALNGVDPATLIIQGCLGGGKTTLQAHIAVALALLGKRLLSCHTNVVTNVFARKVIDLMNLFCAQFPIQKMRKGVIRLGAFYPPLFLCLSCLLWWRCKL